MQALGPRQAGQTPHLGAQMTWHPTRAHPWKKAFTKAVAKKYGTTMPPESRKTVPPASPSENNGDQVHCHGRDETIVPEPSQAPTPENY